MALSGEQSEVLDGASLQIPKRSPSEFAEYRAIPLFALPCSDEEQPCSLETGRGVDESELEHLAGQLAALGEFTQEACCSLVELRDAALNGVLFKHIRNQGFGFERCEGLGCERDLHGPLSPPIAIHRLFDFPACFLGAFVLAAVPRLLPLRQGDFDLGDAVTKINPQRYDGQTLGFDSAGELVNFPFVKEQLARSQGLVVPRAAR